MTDDAVTQQPPYVRLTPSRDDHADQPSVVALPVPRPYGTRNVTKGAIEKSLPDAVGAFLKWLFDESRWMVTERSAATGRSDLVPVRPRHVCLLFRRFTSFNQDVTRPYVQALEARDIAHLLVGGKSFHDREEVETVRAALTAIEWPDDELSVFATLRGALFAIGDELPARVSPSLRTVSSVSGAGPPGGAPAAGGRGADAAARPASAAQLAGRSPTRSNDLLTATRAHVAFALAAGRRAGAGQRAAHRRPGPALRSRRRAVVSRLRHDAGRRGRAGRGARGPDPRGRQRRRAPDDRPQGQGARVSGRRAGGPDLQALAGHRRSPPRSPRGRSARCAWPGGRRPTCSTTSRSKSSAIVTRAIGWPTSLPRVRATCWSCRRRRRAVHRWLAQPAQRRHLPAGRPSARSRGGHGVAGVQARQRARAAQWRSGARRHGAARSAPVR